MNQVTHTIKEIVNQAKDKAVGDSVSIHPAPGDVARQGDVYIRCIGDDMPIPGLEVRPVDDPQEQVANGTSIGSRHTIRNLRHVTIYRLKNPTALQGPIIHAPTGFALDHPEHGDIECGPGVYLITYQRDTTPIGQDEIRAQRD